MKKYLVRSILALLPLGAGLAGYLVFRIVFPGIPLLFFRADIGSAVLVVSAIFTLVLLAWVMGWAKENYRANSRLIEERLRAEQDRRRFIRRLDHELKNPLTGLRAAMVNLRLLLEGECAQNGSIGEGDAYRDQNEQFQLFGGRKEAARTVVDAQHQVERLSRLIADLRKLAELEERPLDTSQVNLADLLESTVDAVSSLPAYTGRVVHLALPRVPWPLPSILGDRDLLELAFYNLMENALKYSSEEDTVEVRAVEDGRRIQVEVADNGPGIAEDDLPRVFDELFRGTNARSLEGSGLGLALVRRVVERHGGEISVRSRQGETRGTVFRVILPIR